MKEAERKQVELSAGTISYRELGSGDPVLFVHGLLVNGRLWDGVAERLAAGNRCIVPDWPMGSAPIAMKPDADLAPPAMAELVAEFIDELGLESPTIVGNDSGGAVSQMLAVRYPDKVGRMVLTNCDMYDNFPPSLFTYLMLAARIPGAITALSQSLRFKPMRRTPIAYGALTKSRLSDELLDAWVRPGLEDKGVRRDGGKFIRGARDEQTIEAAEKLAGFEAPTLFPWAPEDRWFRIEHAERLAATMADARVVRIADAKTFVSIDQPEALAREMSSFLAATSPAPAAA